MELKVGETVTIDGVAVVTLKEKTGRNRARLVFEVNRDVKLQKGLPKPAKAGDPTAD
jgi:ABC-type transporter Mla subunit MlaD